MKVNVPNLQKFIEENYRGNKSFFAEEAKIERSYFNQLMKGRIKNTSPKICNAIIRYCEEKNLNYKDFIF